MKSSAFSAVPYSGIQSLAIWKFLVVDHVEQRHLAHDGAEQVGTLRDHGAHEQASVGAALDGEVILVGIFLGDQVLGGGDHVVEDILFLVEHAGAVPVFAELGPAAQVGDGVDAAVLHPEIGGAAESRA